MSASLVGSEMCIRDRACSERDEPSSALPKARRCADCRRPRLVTRCPIPVSYTHLTLPTICSV
eukprot:5988074-Alexandrium_andersonii.AAC.1